MSTPLMLLAAVLIGLASSYVIERLAWPKRRKTILDAIDATLVIAAHIRISLEDLQRRDPQISGSCELALIDLSEQEFRLRRDRLVLTWI